MRNKMIKGAVSVALVLAMTATTVGCGNKDGSKSKADPALAKIGVYDYKNLDFGFGDEDYYNVIGLGKYGDGAKVVTSSYSYNESTGEGKDAYTVYSIDNKGNILDSSALEMPDTTEYKDGLQSYDDGGFNYSFEDAVGDAGIPGANDVAVLTVGTTIVTEYEGETYDDVNQPIDGDVDYYDDDDDYYYDDYYYGDDYYENSLYESFNFNDVCVAEDGSIVAMAEYYCSGYQDGSYVYCDKYIVIGWDVDGNVKYSTDLSTVVESDWMYITDSAFLSNGKYFALVSGDKTYGITIDENGDIIGKKDASDVKEFESVSSLTGLKDGRLLLVYYDVDDEYSTKCALLDPETITVKEKVSVPESLLSYGLYSTYVGYDTDLVTCTNTGLSKFNLGDSTATEFMNFINSDIDTSNIRNVVMIDSEHFIGSYSASSWDYYGGDSVAIFTYVDPEDIPDKEIINIAVYYVGYDIRSKIIEFNKESDKYRVIVTNYSQYATEDDYTAGYTQMNNDIISGNCPDIVIADEYYLDFSSYANKGLLKDFDELFENDEELKDNEYLNNVFDAYSIGGKHYIAVYSFEYLSLTGSSKIFGDATSWTISDFKNMQSSFPAGSKLMPYLSQSSFLNYVMNYDGYEFVDVENGKCEFDSEDFITLLEYAATLPEEYEYGEDDWMSYENQFRSGQTILNTEYLYDLTWYQQSRYEYFDGETAMVGFPSRTGDSAIISADGTPMAIFKQGNVAGAWEFVRQFFTEEFQDSIEYSIPVLKSSFDDWAAKGMERPSWTNEDGTVEYYDQYYYVDDVQYVVPTMTQEELDKLKDAITSCKKRGYNNQEIYKIIENEASACFSGQKSAADVATVIQSRVQLYINENY